ncbi:MAG TPA: hypothetical protein PK867_10775 [Pirellulales bacterium]|nr:hypothetical protein [Pirellulales bacterium]
MTHVILDPGLLAKLEESHGPLDLCDRSGRIVGTFYPRAAEVDYEAVERARPKLSKEEVERRRQGPTYSTDQVIKYLESL